MTLEGLPPLNADGNNTIIIAIIIIIVIIMIKIITVGPLRASYL